MQFFANHSIIHNTTPKELENLRWSDILQSYHHRRRCTCCLTLEIGCVVLELDSSGYFLWTHGSLAVRCSRKYQNILFKLNVQKSSLGTRYENTLRWMPQNLTSEKIILALVMALCRQASNHYLSSADPYLSRYMVSTRPHWVKGDIPGAKILFICILQLFSWECYDLSHWIKTQN